MFGRRLLGGLVALSLLVTTASAQHSGTQEEQDACTPDVFRLCQAFIPDEAPIVACLKANRAQLSPECHQVFYGSTPVTKSSRHKRKRSDVAQ